MFWLIFLLILIALQLMSWAFARALLWQFALDERIWRKRLIYSVLIISNLPMMLHILRLGKWFRITAGWLTVLWFALLTALAVVLLGKLFTLIRRRPHERLMRLFAALMFTGLFALSLYNAYTPTVRRIQITLDKPLNRPVRIGMAADTHLGVLVGAKQLDKLAAIMQQEKVDLILLPGDIMDDDTDAYYAENMRPHLEKLRAPLGVYATLGNHDLFGREQEITRAVEEAGITVLNDRAVLIGQSFWVVGRPDNLDKNRLPTAELLKQTNPSQAVFLLDHRPDAVLEHAKLPIDLQVSGHVHNGQVFPLNFIVRLLNPIHYGYGRIDKLNVVVTSGFGFWGVPFRLGSQAEVWIIDVKGKDG